ncbi:MAG TPA: endo-1,4-beta-xylanase [Verrucomicrobia bacterium]|nr:endo-1,4-beta-xylanase [Verrucomicrobiota bacterium]HOP97908.1 endo-1,4-beta-xylanase [Verrucomicrobiota bacterium]HPU57347.1 endo-1,4-beta-xylanase [Verrucomicrobiota bacterium]
MRISILNPLTYLGLVLAVCSCATPSANTPTLKDAYKDQFLVGVAISRTVAANTAGEVNRVNRTKEQVESDVALVRQQFNQVTAENDMKWELIHPRPGPDGYDFAGADAFVEFGLKNNMYLVGHTLVWHAQTPAWVFAGTDASRASREELLERMREHIHTVVGRYKGKVKVWDVVNEAIADGGTNILRRSPWLEIIGPDFIARAFQFAHEADPDAILRYNDYGLENPAKRRKLIALIKSLQEQGVPVHAIGSQAHVNAGTTFETMDRALTEMATLGLPIHITELDLNVSTRGQRSTGADVSDNASVTGGGLVDDALKRQAEAYAGLFRAFLKHRATVKMVTLWGVNDAVSWRADGRPLLFDGDNRPKPAFEAVINVASEASRKM